MDFWKLTTSAHLISRMITCWINRAKRPETKQKRLEQMLDELQRGGVYMNMRYSPKD